MVQNPPEGNQRIIPYLVYNDAAAAIEFITKTFGFTERFRIPGPDGTVGHAELGYGGEVVMLATGVADQGHKSPQDLGARHSLVAVYVDDVDAHYERAKAAGAEIEKDIADQFYGDRSYMVKDPEGHMWNFSTHVKDVDFSQMGPGDCGPPE